MNKLFHVLLLSLESIVWANEPAKRLFDDLMIKYNRLRRPVNRSSHELKVRIKLRLSQIIDVVGVVKWTCSGNGTLQHEKTQIMTTIVWLKQEWMDATLHWRPEQYGNISRIYVPSEMIWTPDIVLYNKCALWFWKCKTASLQR